MNDASENAKRFSREEYATRRKRVQEILRVKDLDGLLLRSPENISYLTGYESPTFNLYHALLYVDDSATMVVRSFDEPSVWEYSWDTDTIPFSDDQSGPFILSELIAKKGLADKRLAVEKQGWFFSVDEYETLKRDFPNLELVDISGPFNRLRLVKSDAEIDCIRQSARIAERAVSAGAEMVEPGITENQVAARMYQELLHSGSEYTSLPVMVASGRRTSLPHQTWRGAVIAKGDPVFLETASNVHRYSGAQIRCVSVGEPSKRVRQFADATYAGLCAAIQTIAAGVTAAEVDDACRREVDRFGVGKYFRNRTGYSIGLNFLPGWGEGHILNIRHGEETQLEPNMTFHLVPICIEYGQVGIGSSATVRVVENGCEVLASRTHELLVK